MPAFDPTIDADIAHVVVLLVFVALLVPMYIAVGNMTVIHRVECS